MATNPPTPTEDILADWKESRFIVIDPLLAGYLPHGYVSIILTDIRYWAEREAELDAWCQEHGVIRTGMILEMPQPSLTMFALCWS